MFLFRYPACVRCLGLLCLLGALPAGAYAQFGGLLTRVPPRTNTIVVLNMEKILDSPLAQKENWRLHAREDLRGGSDDVTALRQSVRAGISTGSRIHAAHLGGCPAEP